jgi:hypothetical protein
MNAFLAGLNGQRLKQQVNMIRHYARAVTLQLVAVPEMAGRQSFGASFG